MLNNQKLYYYLIFLILLLACLITRVPYLNFIEISWDESAYLLVGKDIINGRLPYLHNTENKPLLAYLPFALASLFSNSINAIRIIGLIFVFTTSVIIFIILNNQLKISKIFSLIFSIVFVFLCSARFSQWISTEVIALPFISYLIYLMLKIKSNKNIFLIGLVASICVLIRTSLFPLPILCILYLIDLKFLKKTLLDILILSFGGLILPLIILVLYLFQENGLKSLYEHMIILNISYLESSDQILYHAKFILNILKSPYSFFILSLIYLIFFIKSKSWYRQLLLFIAIALLASTFLPGRGYDHYLIQLFPIVTISTAIFFNDIYLLTGKKQKIVFSLLFIFSLHVVFTFLINIRSDLFKTDDNFIKNNYLEISKYIADDDKIFVFDQDIYYVLLNKRPLTPIYHAGLYRFYNEDQIDNMIIEGKASQVTINNIRVDKKRKEQYIFYANNSENTRDEEFQRILNLFPKWIIINIENYEKFLNKKLKLFLNKNWQIHKKLQNDVIMYKKIN